MTRFNWSSRHLAAVSYLILALSISGPPAVRGSYTTMVNNGPARNRVDMVFLGDGYTSGEIETTYVDHIEATLHHMFDERENPYPRYRNFFNVHRINVVSDESGADVPPNGIFRDTALDASYYYDGVTARLLYVSSTKANAVRDRALADATFSAEVQLVTVNDTRYGGGGASYGVYAGGHFWGPEIALHEMGHEFADLADEYGGRSERYTGSEPRAANITKSSAGEKWSHWIGYNQPGVGVIGAYEGAGYYDEGLYRPSENSKMRSLARPFNAVSREKIILDIYDLVDPLDAWRDNEDTLVAPDGLWVHVVDPEVIEVDWLVDGRVIEDADGQTINLSDMELAGGTHTITARAYDPTDWVRINRDALEQTVTWTIEMTAPVVVPEPAALWILAAALAMFRRRD